MCFTAILNISTSMPGFYELKAPRTRLLYGRGREYCCPSKVINKDHLQVKVRNRAEKIRKIPLLPKVGLSQKFQESSSDFIAKKQLAREGSQSVSPVTIPG